MAMREITAPYPLIEFDAHRAARTYAAFAHTLKTNKEAILQAMRSRKENAIAKGLIRASPFDNAEKGLEWAARLCEEKANTLGASMGRAWLPERTVVTLLRMDSGQALQRLQANGDLRAAIGIDCQTM